MTTYNREFFTNKTGELAAILAWLNDPKRHFCRMVNWWFVGEGGMFPQLHIMIAFGAPEDAVAFDIFRDKFDPVRNAMRDMRKVSGDEN